LKSEADLIERLRHPKLKEEAFKELLDVYQERLYWHIRKIVVTHENADDVLQNTFLRIFRGIHSFQGKSSLMTWMFRIAYNESLRFLEKNRLGEGTTSSEDSRHLEILTEDPYFDGDEVKLKLHAAVSQLSEKQRRVFQLKYFDNLRFHEISEMLGVSESTLKSSYYSAVKIIEQRMVAKLAQ
jgi:RNA polymerase sigma-70 factor (ECF subfamily)